MSDSRRRIEALRAKAESTTFPAEAAALRTKADELEAALSPEPAPVDPGCVMMGTPIYYVNGWGNGFVNTTGSANVTQTPTGVTITFTVG